MNRQQVTTSRDGTAIAFHTMGEGDALVLVGGALLTAESYMPLARALSKRFEVHVMERRGRGASGPQGPEYVIEKECEDLEAVLTATGATRVFGHSYGGLVALETAKRTMLGRVAVYEPGVSIRGSIPSDWMPEYRRRLDAGDTRGAMAVFVRGSGHAPAIVRRLPLGYLKLALRIAIRPERWEQMEPLLKANLAEHEQVRRLDSTASSYRGITAKLLLLAGGEGPPARLEELGSVLPGARAEVVAGAGHEAPTDEPGRVAGRLERFFANP